MAFVADDKKLQGQTDQNGQTQAANVGMSGSDSGGEVISGGLGATGTGSGATGGMQAGTGGTGGWTNIQSYLSANQNDTGSAKNLQDKVGGQFSSEKSTLDQQSTDAKTKAQNEADGVKQAQSGAAQMISDASNAYNWNGTQSQAYTDNTGKIKNAINASYSGPSNFNYGFGDQTQQYGSNLQNDAGFKQMVGDMYAERAGGQLSNGGRELQNQLDVNNSALNDTRASLLKEYSGLGDYRNKTVTDTTNALNTAANDFRDNQTNLKNYLQSSLTQAGSDQTAAEAAARSSYANDLTTTHSGLSDFFNNPNAQNSQRAGGDSLLARYVNQAADRQSQGLFGNDLTYGQLADEQSKYSDVSQFAPLEAVNHTVGGMASLRDRNANALNNFYSAEDAKYSSAGDAEKRRYNTIAEILGGSPSKTQGFKVRG